VSQWTHVAGIVRVDTLMGIVINKNPEVELRRLFEPNLPEGSEGPIKLSFIETREYNSMCWGLVAISGDLRDRGDEYVQDIARWMNNVAKEMKQEGLLIRDAVLAIDVEYGPRYVLSPQREGDMTTTKIERPLALPGA
jgi:hypothetical protein